MMAVASPGLDIDRTREALKQAEAQDQWWRSHFDELVQKYAEQFVAVAEGEVVATGNDLVQVTDTIKASGRDPSRFAIHFMATDPKRLML